MENERKSIMLTISWVLLLLLAVALAGGAVASLLVAYRAGTDVIAGIPIEDLARVDPRLPDTLRARRATAAFYAFSCGLLLAWITLTAYRRREKWAWRALLVALGLGCLLSLLRVPFLNMPPTVDSIAILVILLIALLLAYREFR